MKLSAKFVFLVALLVVQFLDCPGFIDPYDENAKVYTQDGNIIFEAAHNKDINFKSNFGQIKLNGVQIQDLLKLITSHKGDQQALSLTQQPQIGKLSQSISDLKEKLKNYEKLQDDVKELKESVKQMLNDNKLKPESVGRAAAGYKKMKKLFDKLKDLLKVNECEPNPCKNSATCLDLFGDYLCQCADGWSGKNCDQDIDECKLYAGTTLGCQNNAQCINTPGNYHCICRNGFQGTHCTTFANSNNSPCSQATNRELCGHGQCVPITNSANNFTYSCICEPGWKKEASSPACTEDIDECEIHRAFAERVLNTKTTDPVELPKQTCSVKPMVNCVNTLGSFRCGPCPSGYSGNGQFCFDINECEVNNGGCSVNPFVQCINTEGSNVCGACPENYSGDGVNCRQIDTGLATGVIYSSTVHIHDEPCPTNPCLNDAPCYLRNGTDRPKDGKTMNKNDFYCACDVGFSGKYCETIVNYCIQESGGTNKTLDLNGPCKNNGTCYSLIGGYTCTCQAGWQGENCEEPLDACGGDLVAENGTIKFPAGDFQLLPGKNGYQCEWRIDTLIGKVIEIKIKKINLEPTTSCALESLKIFDGIPGFTQNRQLLKVCGNLKDFSNQTVSSAHNFVQIVYNRDYSISEESFEGSFGFELDWKTVDPTCGGLINASSHGTINSPGYPTGYPQLSDCIWVLKTKFNQRIQLYFAELAIEEDGNCVNDYVQLFDGETDQDPSLGKFCKGTVPPPITSSGPFVRIQFVSDAFSTDKGFHLTYNPVPAVENCGGLFTNEKDHIVSPGKFGVKYPDNIECFYLIRLKDKNEKIKVTIKFLELEEHKGCKFDYLEFYDGADEYAPKKGRYCLSKSTNTTIISSSNVMLIKFRTDKSFRGNGFILAYEKWCYYTITGTSGIVKSIGYPKLPRGEHMCGYEISVPEKNLIKLEFQDFDLELTPNCTSDSLFIMETQNSVNAVYCGDTIPDTYVSSFNSLILVLGIKNGLRHRGFKLSFSVIEVDCGGIFKTSPGFFSSPTVANGQTYKPNARCNWVIRAPESMIIKLTFNTFAIEKNGNCKFDYVRVMDSQFNEIGKYCGTDHPPLIQSIDNELIVEFASDKSRQLDGFSASFVFANQATTCGGHFAQESAEIVSPGFYTQKRYEPNLNCVWHIVAALGKQIRLNFTFLDVESNDCTFDKIEVHNGPEIGSPLLATICGTNLPPLLVSHGNELTINFITDSNKEAKGFRLTYDTALTGSCGGTLSTPTGQVSSPHYPKPYHANAVCDYLIFVAKGSTVQLNFIEIDIERDSLCQYDYVELFDGSSEFSPKIGRYCNQNQNPGIVRSTSNAILVRFRSDASFAGKGFLLNYLTNCTNKLTGYRGVIESFNFPYNWYAPFDCRYEISVPRGNRINVVITNLELEESENEDCSRLSLTINQLGGSGEVKKNLTRKFCDTKKIDENLLNFNSTTDTIEILFKKSELQESTDRSKSSLRLEYYLVGCGGEFLYKQRGLIQTPSYPMTHSYELDCIWHIQTSPGNRIVLNIIDFDLSTGGKCVYGYVKVFGGPTAESPELAKICEKTSSATKLTSSGSAMTIMLKNGLGISGRGLNAQFYVEYHKGCGGVWSLNEGTITSRNYPAPYDSTDDCFYAIESSEMKQIEIKVVDLKLPALRNCTGGYLKIYDGRTSSSPLLSKHCGENFEPFTVKSNSSKVLIEFRGSGHATSGGFKLTYKMVCGGTVAISRQGTFVLTNPNYPFLPPDRECVWHYTCEFDQKMAVTVTHLESTTYFQSKIQFHAGPSVDSPIIKTVQRSIPDVFVVPGNSLTISSNRTVFRLFISTLTNQCGGTIRVSGEGEMASPGWPENYPMGVTCEWRLISGFSNRIMLKFMDFKLQQSDFCNLDYLEIREDNSHGRLIGRFCGNELPTIDSEFLHPSSTANESSGVFEMGYNRLWIRFRSGRSGSDAGFRIQYSLLNLVYLNNDTGVISNSQYPSMTIADEAVVWRIITSESTVVSVTVKRIQLTMLRDVFCLSKLNFVDGDLMTGTVISQVCGNEPPENPIVSSTNQMTIAYIGSGRSMFLLEYKAINQLAYEANKTLENQNVTSGNCSEEIHLNYATNNVVITSPGYPDGYDNNLLCTWLVRSAIGQKIAIKVDFLNIEAGSCNYDKLNVFDRNLNDEIYLNQTLCGRKKDVSLMSNSNLAKIQFESDSVGNGTGFQATLSTACGGYVMGEQKGVLSYNAGTGEKSFKCDWVIAVRPKRKMSLIITSLLFSAHQHEDCSEDFLLIRDGPTINSPILGKYCNRTSEILNINETSSNQVYVTFYALKPLYQSFSLNYEEVRVGCTQKYRLQSKEDVQIIQSPNYPNPPIGIIECDWTFLSPPSTTMRIDFKILNPNIPCNLTEQAISVYNGGSVLSGLLIRDCPRVSSVFSTENMMHVNYITNGENLHAAFQASVQVSVCGGTYLIKSSRVHLRSKNYGLSNYPNNLNCRYYFKTEMTGYNIEFRITKLDLANNTEPPLPANYSDCAYAGDFLEIHDSDQDGPLLGRFCGTNRNRVITVRSFSDAAYLLFKTDAELNARGFTIELTMQKHKCGEEITNAEKGVIKSHNYDSEISASLMKSIQRRCRWTLVAPLGNRLEVTFKKVNLKSDPTNRQACIDDLAFYSQPLRLRQNIRELNTKSRCNFVAGQKIVSLHNIMIIEFNTFGLNENEGFIIEYDGTKEALCGGLLNDTGGTIEMSVKYLQTRNVTVNYHDSLSCLWHMNPSMARLKTLSNFTFVLTVDQLDFPEPQDSSLASAIKSLKEGQNIGRELRQAMNSLKDPCGNNSVQIRQVFAGGMFSFNHAMELCGNLTGRNLYYIYPHSTLHQPVIFAHMVVEREPYLMRIHYKYNRCGNTFYSLGTYASPNFGESDYENDLLCVYVVNVFSAGRLVLEFSDFELEQDAECKNDYVEILNGELPDQSPSLGRFCGKEKPKQFITSGQAVTVIFRTNGAVTAKGFQFSVSKYASNQTCGRDIQLTRTQTMFSASPYFGGAYKNNMSCVWTIETPATYHMNIEFPGRFDLEQSPNCTKDYVLIEEKEAENKWRTLNRLCGIKRPDNIRTASNVVRISFITDQNVTGDGFAARVSRECGRVFDDESPTEGYLYSPGYPYYDSELDCEFVFNRTRNEFIILKLEDFNITDCPNDYLMIVRDKQTDSTPVTTPASVVEVPYPGSQMNSLIYAKKLGPFCGENKPPEVITNREYLRLNFKTDSFKASRGFKFGYRIVECGRDFVDQDSGIIRSPNVEEAENGDTSNEKGYIHNADCIWHIKMPQNYSIVLRFEKLNIEVCGRQCHCDFVEVLEIDKSATPLAKLCGHNKFPIIKSVSNEVRIHFHSDYTGSAGGFKLVFSKVVGEKLGCGKTIFANSSGILESPDINKDGLYDQNLDCIWTLTVPDQSIVKLTFEMFDLEETNDYTGKCRDYLQVNDGSSSAEPLIDVFCGKRKPDQIQSSSNRLFLYFKSDDLNEGKGSLPKTPKEGFRIRYEPVQSSCGGQIHIQSEDEFTNGSSYIESPNYPLSYPNNIRCKWQFTVPFYIRLELNIVEFNLNCTNNDYLQISMDRKHEDLIKLCTESEYLNNRRLLAMSGLWLVFSSGQGTYQNNLIFNGLLLDENSRNKAAKQANPATPFRFKIGYKVLGCNQTYTTENGLIVNSKYPSIWTSNSNEICRFTIETDPDRTISVYFIEFSIGKPQLTSSNCDENRMEIKDGKEGNSRKIAVLCGFKIPNPVFSSGNVLSFQVRAHNTYNKYNLYYTTTDQGIGCGGNLTSFNGTFTSPLYPNFYYAQGDQKECNWSVHSLGQNKLEIRFETFEFNNTNRDRCNVTYLEIYDGETMNNDTHLITLCPQDQPTSSGAANLYTSFTSFLHFKLVIGDPSEGVRFKINYNINTIRGVGSHIFTAQNKENYLPNDGFNNLVGN